QAKVAQQLMTPDTHRHRTIAPPPPRTRSSAPQPHEHSDRRQQRPQLLGVFRMQRRQPLDIHRLALLRTLNRRFNNPFQLTVDRRTFMHCPEVSLHLKYFQIHRSSVRATAESPANAATSPPSG